jgi:hypothetical protein
MPLDTSLSRHDDNGFAQIRKYFTLVYYYTMACKMVGSKGGFLVIVFPSVEEGMQSQLEVDKEPSPQNPKHHKTKFGAFLL